MHLMLSIELLMFIPSLLLGLTLIGVGISIIGRRVLNWAR